MADPFVAEIRIMTANFAPRGWAFCDGQLLPLSQNTALFSLLGATYGGDGKSNFALPDLRGRAPMFYGQGPGLTERFIGESDGTASVALTETEIPSHTHAMQGQAGAADLASPGGGSLAARTEDTYGARGARANLHAGAIQAAGGGLPHNNMQPYLALNFCIALQGVFPPRT